MSLTIPFNNYLYSSIRGALGTLLSLNWTGGIVLGYVFASWMNYFLVPFVSIGICVAFILIFIWFPESPDFLTHTRQLDLAKRSYAFYKTNRVPEANERSCEDYNEAKKTSWSDFRNLSVQRGCLIALVLVFFADTCGYLIITHYVTEILNRANVQLDVYVSTVVLGLIQILGCLVSTFFIDRCGRRLLFMTSAILSGLALFVFGLYFNLLERQDNQFITGKLHWLPVVVLAFATLSIALAIGAAPFFLIAELLPVKIRGIVTMVALTASAIFSFLVVHSYHQLVDLMGVDGTFWCYASICMVEAVFVFFYLPETKNLSIEQIQEILGRSRSKD